MKRARKKAEVDPDLDATIDEILAGIPESEPGKDSRESLPAEEPPELPGFAMQDEPFEGQEPDPEDTFVPLGVAAQKAVETIAHRVTREVQEIEAPLPTLHTPVPPRRRYTQRIRIVEEFQYNGTLKGAPVWIDRNWVAYADFDERTRQPAGPAIAVPGVGLARRGDFIVRQEVMLTPDHGDERIAIYSPEEFYRLWLPVE